jgi:hypothetical protein
MTMYSRSSRRNGTSASAAVRTFARPARIAATTSATTMTPATAIVSRRTGRPPIWMVGSNWSVMTAHIARAV